jgi:hypothetical protein
MRVEHSVCAESKLAPKRLSDEETIERGGRLTELGA